MWSSVVSARASRTGGYHGATSTLVPRRTRSVTAAASVSDADRVERRSVCSGGSSPSGEAGYGVRGASGASRRSIAHSDA